jgi:adenylate cyclase, class 2
MNIINVEFKARVDDSDVYEEKLAALWPVFKGIDHQLDTYFKTTYGRLKLREGNIENALIQYNRQDFAGARQSQVMLYNHQPNQTLKEILSLQFGVLKVVDKQRKIYFIENVKFHFDKVKGLGDFIEVEAIDDKGERKESELKAQCDHYAAFFGLTPDQFMEGSYSDMT